MARPTTEALLEAVENGILDLATGKATSYTIRGRSFTRSSLGELRALRDDLLKQHSRESGAEDGTGIIVAEWS